MSRRLARLIVAILIVFGTTSTAFAGRDNTFSGTLLLGDSYAPNNFRLSFGSFDLGLSDMSEVYAGSRAWLGNYYAGFGFGTNQVVYGLVGYEWRFLSWLGMTFEFDGTMSVRGESAGRVYIGFVAGW